MTNNSLDVLIGSQILTMSKDKIIVKKNGVNYTLIVDNHESDWGGFNLIETTLNYGENSSDNPIITKIWRSDEDSGYGSTCTVTFYGGSKVVGVIDTESSSGSGWAYGACVSLECEALGIDELLSSW